MREWYNGYSWTGESVYNPFDILLFFDSGIFRPYWFETGTPSFLIKT
ncbi:AAA family ATPase [Methanospirillum sp.]|nr:AAA family ATPase [Methanospirillum sp.]